MSRSYKHTPYCGDETCKREGKRFANKRVRHKLRNEDFEIANGKAYCKLYERWNIVDYYCIESWQEYLNHHITLDDGLFYWTGYYALDRSKGYTYKELYWQWYRWYKRK